MRFLRRRQMFLLQEQVKLQQEIIALQVDAIAYLEGASKEEGFYPIVAVMDNFWLNSIRNKEEEIKRLEKKIKRLEWILKWL